MPWQPCRHIRVSFTKGWLVIILGIFISQCRYLVGLIAVRGRKIMGSCIPNMGSDLALQTFPVCAPELGGLAPPYLWTA